MKPTRAARNMAADLAAIAELGSDCAVGSEIKKEATEALRLQLFQAKAMAWNGPGVFWEPMSPTALVIDDWSKVPAFLRDLRKQTKRSAKRLRKATKACAQLTADPEPFLNLDYEGRRWWTSVRHWMWWVGLCGMLASWFVWPFIRMFAQ